MGTRSHRECARAFLSALKKTEGGTSLRRNTILNGWRANSEGVSDDVFYEVLWDLVGRGLVALIPDVNRDYGVNDFRFLLTVRGVRFVDSEGQFNPDDPDRFLDLFRQRMPGIDDLAYRYVRESVLAYRAECFLASAVMLGAASERMILLLGQAFIATGRPKQSFRDTFQSTKGRFGDKLEALADQLVPTRDELPRHLADKLQPALNAVAQLLRQTRNDAGHPSGIDLTDDQMHTNLTTAAYYLETIHGLTRHFEAEDGG